LGTGSRQIPQPGGGKEVAGHGREKSRAGSCKGTQSSGPRLFHRSFGIVNRLASCRNSSAKLRRYFHLRRFFFTSCEKGQRQQETACKIQRLSDPPLRKVYTLETKNRRTNRPDRSTVSVEQYEQAYDQAGNPEGLQKNRSKSRFVQPLLNSFVSPYLRMPVIQGKRLQFAAGSKTAWPLQQQNYGSVRRRVKSGPEEVTGKTLFLKKLQIVFWILIILSVPLKAEKVSLPGKWYDTDKAKGEMWYYDDLDQDDYWEQNEPYGWEKDPGWQYWKTTHWKQHKLCFDDLDADLQHDAGEPIAWYPEQSWTNGLQKLNGSCWIASASDMLKYVGGPERYEAWAYEEGVLAEQYTFDDAGEQINPLNSDGFSHVQDYKLILLWPFVPVDWVKERLSYNLPVGIGITGPSAHSLTVYEIDTDNQTITVADSDRDSYTFTTYNYQWDGVTWSLPNYLDQPHNIVYVCSFTPYLWQGSGTGGDTSTAGPTVEWTNATNWSENAAPTNMDMVEIFFENNGQLDITGNAYAYRLDINRSWATVDLEEGGSLDVNSDMIVGNSGSGFFRHWAGDNNVSGNLYIANTPNSVSSYDLFSGQLSCENEYVGVEGTARVYQASGTNYIRNNLVLGKYPNSSGEYELYSNSQIFTEGGVIVGQGGNGTFTQEGGEHDIGLSLQIGRFGKGVYNLKSGVLDVPTIHINTFPLTQGEGYLKLNGGALVTDILSSSSPFSHFQIMDSNATLKVYENLKFGQGYFEAVSESKINMINADFKNYSTDDLHLTGLKNTDMIFSSYDGNDMAFEVAGRDMGPYCEGFINNFHMDTLTLTTNSTVVLEDSYTNIPEKKNPDSNEALYINGLVIEENCLLKLNGLNVYTKYFRGLPVGQYTLGLDGIEFDGGNLFIVSDMDFNDDYVVDFKDFAKLANAWMGSCCEPGWCDRTDYDRNGQVGNYELGLLANSWLNRSFNIEYANLFPLAGDIKALALDDNLLLVGAGSHLFSIDPNDLFAGDTMYLDNISLNGLISDVVIDSNIAYCATQNTDAIYTVNISNPASMFIEDMYEPAEDSAFLDIDVSDDLLFVADHWNGLRILDISDPCNIHEVRKDDLNSYEHGVCSDGSDGGYVYVSSGDSTGSRLTILSGPLAETERGYCSTQAYPAQSNIAVKKGLCYVLSKRTMEIANISNPAYPRVIAAVPIEYGHEVIPDKYTNIVFVASANEGLVPVLVSDPANPVKLPTYELSGTARSVAVGEEIICVGLQEGGIDVFRRDGW